MIKIYYRPGVTSCQRAISWCEKYGLDVQLERINKITRADLMNLLLNSNEGILDIIKRSGKSSSSVNKAINYMMNLSLAEAIDFILSHTDILQAPIIIENSNHLIGFNEDEIRVFLPKQYRRHNL
ncbi:ArsC/Spx/MgsR family protein [Lactococcus garvieae]|uniref:ArsC/Spx/MgsR family protein n=1 Tax=Lactococcus garvieae TaxID=1363 RepID=UPI0038535238